MTKLVGDAVIELTPETPRQPEKPGYTNVPTVNGRRLEVRDKAQPQGTNASGREYTYSGRSEVR